MWPPAVGISDAYTLGTRLLVLLTTILILVMPATECLWQFNHCESQDIELSLLSLLTFILLVSVVLQQRRRSVTILLTIWRRRSSASTHTGPWAAPRSSNSVADFNALFLPADVGPRYTLPIQV